MEDKDHLAVADAGGAQGHTAGPWAVHPLSDGDGAIVTIAGHTTRSVGGSTNVKADRDDYALKLCTIYKESHGRNNVMADARLIAAAPMLLAALQSALCANNDDWQNGSGWDKKARAAIAAATKATP